MDSEEIYNVFQKHIDDVNSVISTFGDNEKFKVGPQIGTVVFGSGLHGWGFTLDQFAKLYSEKFGIPEEKLKNKLWGENYYCPTTKHWTKKSTDKDGNQLKQSFCQFVIYPIQEIFNASHSTDPRKLDKILQSIKIKLSEHDAQLKGNKLFNRIMSLFLPLSDSILNMIVSHLPSPTTAQSYRYQHLYQGPLDDKYAKSISICDSKGPILILISKLIPLQEKGRFLCIGRIFSGSIKSDQKITILGTSYELGKKNDLFPNKPVTLINIVGKDHQKLEELHCGNICGFLGVDRYILSTGTIIGVGDNEAHPLHKPKFSQPLLVKSIISPKYPKDLPKMVESLRYTEMVFPCAKSFVEDSGDLGITTFSEMDLEKSLQFLKENCLIPLDISQPFVAFKETITSTSSDFSHETSPNSHNKIYMSSEPLDEQLVEMIQNKQLTPETDKNTISKILKNRFEWDEDHSKSIWCFGPNTVGPNLLVNQSKDVQYINEIKDSVVTSFEFTTKAGVLCEEELQGFRVNILDVVLHSDAIHRGAGQIIPMARKCIYQCQKKSEPRLLEPMYKFNILCPKMNSSKVLVIIQKRRGAFVQQQNDKETLSSIEFQVPVLESFGLNYELQAVGSIVEFQFDTWKIIGGSPFDEGISRDLVNSTRERKGLASLF